MEFEIYSSGFVHCSVCTSLPVEQAVERINRENPTGIDSQWKLSEDTHFARGNLKNGCDCPDHKGNKHYLMVC